ncbi:MAG: sugar kinase [Boseongicola sp.]
MTRVACIGEPMIEVSMRGDTAGIGVAGDTLNSAIYLKRSEPEIEVDYITRLGDDPFSMRIRDAMTDEDIGTEKIQIERGGSPGLYAISLSDTGERSFTYWRSASAARNLFSDGDFSPLEGYDLVYLSAISMAILPHSVRKTLIAHIKSADIPVAYDSNHRPKLWDSIEHAREVTNEFWGFCHIPLPSIDDEMELFAESEAAVIERTKTIHGVGALKRGEIGPLSIGEDVNQTYPPADEVIDTTAAGDSFNGGYLAARLRGMSQTASLLAGHKLAAKVVGYPGAIIPR